MVPEEFRQPEPEVEEAESEPGDILRMLLKSAHNIHTILVIGTDKDGITGFVSNLDGVNEVLAYMRKVEFQILQGEVNKP